MQTNQEVRKKRVVWPWAITFNLIFLCEGLYGLWSHSVKLAIYGFGFGAVFAALTAWQGYLGWKESNPTSGDRG